MISRDFVEEDLQLKAIAKSSDQQMNFDWASRLGGDDDLAPVSINLGENTREFRADELVQLIGQALTNQLLARREENIYTDENRRVVQSLAEGIFQELGNHSSASDRAMGRDDIQRIVERTLIRQGKHDLLLSCKAGRTFDSLFAELDDVVDHPQVKTRVIRRSGDAVTWNQQKIENAISKAFLAVHQDPAPAKEIARMISREMADTGQEYVHIENLQNLVQRMLMDLKHYEAAEAYILYRAHRTSMRLANQESESAAPVEDAQQGTMLVVRRQNGETYFWDGSELRKRISFAKAGLDLCLSEDEIETELRRSLFNEIANEDLNKVVIMNARNLIEKDADFSKFAARVLLTYIYEEVLDWNIHSDGVNNLQSFHKKAFQQHIARGVELGRLNPKLLDFDLDMIAKHIDPAADLSFDYLGVRTLYDRYLIVDKKSKPERRLETPQLFWIRVAMGLFIGDDSDEREQKIINLYNLYKSRRFCSSTPTLFNSGTMHSQLSSCYLYKVDDSIESIMTRGIAENAYLSKWAGGLGGSWTAIRGTGSYIQGTNGESQGVIPFLKLHNDQLVAVNQGGKRRGSGCAYLETWHNDIFDFLELRKNTGDERRRCHDMHTANWIPDLFMKRMEARGDWTLFRSNEAPDLHELYGAAFEKRYEEYEAMAEAGEIKGKKIPAIELWKAMLKMLFETGHPWITFKDVCNVRNPQDHTGVIHSSNLCTEITLNTSEDETAVCNLGSVVLDQHLLENGEIDHEKLRETVRIAVEALDNVIDINFYPTDAARNANQRHRPIGLGIMGMQNALFMRGTPFASDEAIEFNDEIMEAVAYYAYEASSDLAAAHGTYATYEGSKWDRGLLPHDTVDLLERERDQPIEVKRGGKMDWQPLRDKIAKQGMRNSNVLAIAPTATISNIMGSSPCIEPYYQNLYVKSNLGGDFTVLNAFLVRDLKKLGLWDSEMVDNLKYFDGELDEIGAIPDDIKKRYQTAFSIPYRYYIEAAARRQKWIDQSQSVNLYFKQADFKTLSHMYRAAWHSGLKTTYYLRTLGATGIEKASVTAGQTSENTKAPSSERAAMCALNAQMNGEECEACQ